MTKDTIIIGAGPAGLAVGACLTRRGHHGVILEQSDQVGDSWNRHYPSLRLHTTRRRSALPHRSFDSTYPRYPSRDDMTRYLRDYAAHFELDVSFKQKVDEVRREGDRWRILISDGNKMFADHVVVATGYHQMPHVPALPGEGEFQGEIMHSITYEDGTRWRNQHVLVVGPGNSGANVAVDLFRAGARPTLSVRGPLFLVPLEILGVSWRDIYRFIPYAALALGGRYGGLAAAKIWCSIQKYYFHDLEKRGISLISPSALVRHWATLRPPLTDNDFVDLIRRNRVEIRGATIGFDATGALFEGGDRADYSAVVFATGFSFNLFSFVKDLKEWWSPEALPPEGSVPGVPGLYFCGFRPELQQIAATAHRIADNITGTRTPSRQIE